MRKKTLFTLIPFFLTIFYLGKQLLLSPSNFMVDSLAVMALCASTMLLVYYEIIEPIFNRSQKKITEFELEEVKGQWGEK